MILRTAALTFPACLAATMAAAEAPRIVVDIAPIHSLVAQVTEGVAEPALIVEGVVDAHTFSLRPSQAALLQDADVFIFSGEGLMPWLHDAGEDLTSASLLALLETDGWEALERRDTADFTLMAKAEEGHDDHDDHGHEDHGHEDHGHEDHEDHAHDDHGHEDHEDHAHEDHGHDDHGHDHGDGPDPHAWLSPAVATVWLTQIADVLSEADPDNAAAYRANATAAQAELAALEAQIAESLAPVAGASFVLAHDALQYFEAAFELPAMGALAVVDGASPGPQRIREVQNLIAENGVSCILTDQTISADWSDMLAADSGAATAFVDPLGGALEPGTGLYADLLTGIANSISECVSG